MAQDASSDDAALLREITFAMERAHADLIGVRRDLHTFPDGSGAEARTAGIVAERTRFSGSTSSAVGGKGGVPQGEAAR